MNRRTFLLFGLTGCLLRPPVTSEDLRAATPETEACAKLRTHHNDWLLVSAFGGTLAGSGGAVVAVETDQGQKIGTVAASVLLGASAAVATVVAGIDANSYTQQCTIGK